MDFFDKAIKVFSLDEGTGKPLQPGMPYRDTKGLWTIGIGHLIGESLSELQLSQHIINELFKEDLAQAIKDSRDSVGEEFFNSLTDARKLALITMLFTLGRGKWAKFEETLTAIKNRDWTYVAERILQTKWADDIDPKQRPDQGRDDRIAFMFKTGRFHPDYKIKEI